MRALAASRIFYFGSEIEPHGDDRNKQKQK
jgi:hypothetical protein